MRCVDEITCREPVSQKDDKFEFFRQGLNFSCCEIVMQIAMALVAFADWRGKLAEGDVRC